MLTPDKEQFRDNFEYIVKTTVKVSTEISNRLDHSQGEVDDNFVDMYSDFTKCMEYIANYLRLVKVSVESKEEINSWLERLKNDFPL